MMMVIIIIIAVSFEDVELCSFLLVFLFSYNYFNVFYVAAHIYSTGYSFSFYNFR